MINDLFAVDSCSYIAHLQDEDAPDVAYYRAHESRGIIRFPPAVIAEVLTDPKLDKVIQDNIQLVKMLDSFDGYWARTGLLRASLFQKGFKPKLPDTLIAQSCIDHDVPLLTRDDGFAMFAEHGGLKLVDTGG